jgi:hypothetical protein
VSAPRIHFRPPGVKTGSRIGPLGPFRGTLGIHWVIGSIAVGLLILLVGTLFLFRLAQPDDPFRRVGNVEGLAPGTAREVLDGVYVGRATNGQPYAVAQPGPTCSLEVMERGYRDCFDLGYGFDGEPFGNGQPLSTLPLEVYRGQIYVDPTSAGSSG